MKQINRLFHSTVVTHARGAFLAGLATLAVIALATSALISPIRATGSPGHEDEGGRQLAKEAEVLDLLSGYHGALANGGNLEAMASLWADDSTLTLNNGTPYVGKDAVLGFFANGPYFSHNWLSLAPEWKTTVTVHGNMAEATTECIATDVSVTPNVVRGVIQVNATAARHQGKWHFISMDNFTVPQI
jgi:SnoaL-like domain